MLSLPRRIALPAAILMGLALALAGCLPPRSGGPAAGSGNTYLFCFWNAENFFDDKADGYGRQPDKGFDAWFAGDPQVFRQKLDNLTSILLSMNDGKGPDIIALAEVETKRAADKLRDALNGRLQDTNLHYGPVQMEDVSGGRHISPAVLTRLHAVGRRTQMLDRRHRILETHIEVNGHDLVVIASHWTSRVSDRDGNKKSGGRAKYGDLIYGRFKAMVRSNPKVDLLVCGDFNDNPDDPSVTERLHAVGDREKVLSGEGPYLYDLFAELWERTKHGGKDGTHFYRGHAFIFDQIAVSPGMLQDTGWRCDPDSVAIVKDGKMTSRKGTPIPFGTERDRTPLGSRGASDHFPVTVRLAVAGK